MKLPSALLFSLAFTCGALGTTSTARADDPTVVQARARFKEGVTHFDAGRYDAARSAFLQAYTLKPHPSVLLNLAQSELRSGRAADAANHFSEFLTDNPGAKPAEIASAQKGLEEAKAGVSELSIELAGASATGVELFVDGKSAGKAPLARPLYVSPGEHLVEARDGDRSTTARVYAPAGGPVSANLTFAGAPPEEAPPEESVAAPPEPSVATAPPESTSPIAPSAGRPSFFEWLFDSPVGITGVGLTAAGLGVGITGSIVANSRYGSAQDAQDEIVTRARNDNQSGVICRDGTSPSSVYAPACAERQDRLDSGDTWTTIAVIGYAGAAVSAAGTVIYYLATTGDAGPPEAPISQQSARLVPVVSHELRGVSLQGTF